MKMRARSSKSATSATGGQYCESCNSHNQRRIAQHCQISFLAPGRLGMRLVAEAHERHRGGRSGICDVTVKTDAGEVIAEFRGQSRAISGTLVPEA